MTPSFRLSGIENGHRVDSRRLEERLQQAVAKGHRYLEVEAFGQHGLGGRLWRAGREPVTLRIYGTPGQRVGAMGFPNTRIEVLGPASDDVGWLNAGAEIIVHGNATNGVANAMAQGRVYISGSIGARGMTMTKHNPRFDPPELWVLGGVGDYFAEFMAGGVAVVCGVEPQDPENVLGYRPCVGMVGGRIFFRGAVKGVSEADARIAPPTDSEWGWLSENLTAFLSGIRRSELFEKLSERAAWQVVSARSAREKAQGRGRRSMHSFCGAVWERELGAGGLIGDLTTVDRSLVPLVTTGHLRRYVPIWQNRAFAPPCEASCPTGIPVQERWRLVREGRIDEAVDMALSYTPFPASVCGYLCPNLCMQGCSRGEGGMTPVDVTVLGKASIAAKLPVLPPLSGKKVAVVGGGPAGISVAWQLRRLGVEAVIHDMAETLGGKLGSIIPKERVPEEVVAAELARVREVLPSVRVKDRLTREGLEALKAAYDFVVVAVGAGEVRPLPVPGGERAVGALRFLREARTGGARVGRRVVIVGAGNVGCDAALEARRLGAESVTLIRRSRIATVPSVFDRERRAAESVGAKFRGGCHVRAITEAGVELTTGEVLPADTVLVAIGDQPDLSFLPEGVATERGFVTVDEHFRTSDPKVFAIGDAVKLGLLTEAIGAGRKAARAISDLLSGRPPKKDARAMLSRARVSLQYLDPRREPTGDLASCASACSSCGACRDCGICVEICPKGAITRKSGDGGAFEMVVSGEKCIGCGFCGAACPCGVWNLVENAPLDEPLAV